jgi:hypothetical protein
VTAKTADSLTMEAMTTNGRDRSTSPEISGLDIGEDFSALPEYKTAGITTVDFAGLLSLPLLLREDMSSGCGGQTWPAGMVLAKHMLRYHKEDLGDAKVYVFPR